MGLYYNGKLDIQDFMWKPRLLVNTVKDILGNLGVKVKSDRRPLPMKELKGNAFPYPRPQFVRNSYWCLNGKWDFSASTSPVVPLRFTKKINVPYPPQSERSGIDEQVKHSFWYRKRFRLPEGFVKDRVILHFGAVDQIAAVIFNGKYLGSHEGGYLPFSFDITELLKNSVENEILVYVRDEINPRIPYGKQVHKPGGMWYPQVSGIWQSVWIESVPAKRIDSIKCSWHEGEKELSIIVKGNSEEYEFCLESPIIYDRDKHNNFEIIKTQILKNGENRIKIENPKLWSPEHPYLYYFILKNEEDMVRSYYALRTIDIKRIDGVDRLCLNGQPYFFHGVLDQGYFSEGMWTPPSYRYYEKDIRSMKELGFNTLRKHIKIEPDQFYYDCDRIGMAVFQDMVNNGDYSYIRDTIMPTVLPNYVGHRKSDKKIKVAKEIRECFVKHSEETIDYLYNFPCILYYTIFNEGWGQFHSDKVLAHLKKRDNTRIYDSTSGWYKQNDSDVESVHCYFHKVPFERSKWTKPVVVSEFGGYCLRINEHCAYESQSFGYGEFDDVHRLTKRIERMYMEEIIPHMRYGICGAIYTQLSDVEEEINGLYTYDRKVCKVEKDIMQRVAKRLMKENENYQ